MRYSELVGRVPRVVAEETRLAVVLILDGGGRELEVLEVPHQAIGKQDPKLALRREG